MQNNQRPFLQGQTNHYYFAPTLNFVIPSPGAYEFNLNYRGDVDFGGAQRVRQTNETRTEVNLSNSDGAEESDDATQDSQILFRSLQAEGFATPRRCVQEERGMPGCTPYASQSLLPTSDAITPITVNRSTTLQINNDTGTAIQNNTDRFLNGRTASNLNPIMPTPVRKTNAKEIRQNTKGHTGLFTRNKLPIVKKPVTQQRQ